MQGRPGRRISRVPLARSRHDRARPSASASVLLAGSLLLTTLAMRQAPVLRAERIELLSPSGAPQAVLAADSSGVYLTLLDARGRPAGALRLNGEPWLSVRAGQWAGGGGLGCPRCAARHRPAGRA